MDPSPLWVVRGRPPFSRACAAVRGCVMVREWAIVLLLPAGPVPDANECSFPEVVRIANVPHDPHVAVTSLRDGRAVEQGFVVVYQPSCSTAVWGAEYTTALDAIQSVCGCDVAWRAHAVYRPKPVLSPELTASSAASLGKVAQSPHSDVAWLEPHRYCWVPAATKVTSSDASPQGDGATNVAVASHGSPTWTGAIRGTVPEAEVIGAAAYLLHTPPSACTVHLHHWSAPAQGAGSPILWHQGADLTFGQLAPVELDSGGAAAAITQSQGAAPFGGEAELTFGGSPTRRAGLCCSPCNGPACSSPPAQGGRRPLGAQ